jgi:hypothetical protein
MLACSPRARSGTPHKGRPTNRTAAAVIAALWLSLAALAILLVARII